MRARLSVAGAVVLVVLAYAASPYVALWRLESALQTGDAATLEHDIDWKSVREGLKQDIADGIIGPLQTQLASNTLPPFGSSFVNGIADTAVEREVTPQNLIAVMRQMRRPTESPASMLDCFSWAFFQSPTSFEVVVSQPSDDPDEGHLRVRLELHQGHWMVMRAWIPQDLVDRAGQRT